MPNQLLHPVWERFDPRARIGSHLIGFTEVDSTMDVAWSYVNHGAAHGTVVIAEQQLVGRGRFQRKWESARGASLLVSVIVRSPPIPLGFACMASTALAVFDTVAAMVTAGTPGIKWPNDILVDGKKIAGVLIESRVDADGVGVQVIGIGINVNYAPAERTPLAESATSLAAEGASGVSVSGVCDLLIARLDVRMQQASERVRDVLADWSAHLETIGKSVQVHTRQGVVAGIATGIDAQGCLLVETADGRTRVLTEGDVTPWQAPVC